MVFFSDTEAIYNSWQLSKPARPFCREVFQHRVKNLRKELGIDINCYDDVITMNTQGSSQWDGFRWFLCQMMFIILISCIRPLGSF